MLPVYSLTPAVSLTFGVSITIEVGAAGDRASSEVSFGSQSITVRGGSELQKIKLRLPQEIDQVREELRAERE